MEKMGLGILGTARIAASARLVAVAVREGNWAAEYVAQPGIPQLPGRLQAVRQMRVLDALYASARAGEAVPVG